MTQVGREAQVWCRANRAQNPILLNLALISGVAAVYNRGA
jgi:hypothetical protein